MKLQTIFKSAFACVVISFLATSCQYDKLLPDAPPPPYVTETLNEYFDNAVSNTNFSAKGWKNITVKGDRAWQGKIFNSEKYVQATFHTTTTPTFTDGETWLITPTINVAAAKEKILNFKTEKAYWQRSTKFEVLYSTTYDGGDVIDTLQWKPLPGVILPDSTTTDFKFISSGPIDLSALGNKVNIAYRYRGIYGNKLSTTWIVDDVTFNPQPTLTVAPETLTFTQLGEAKNFTATTNQDPSTLVITKPSWITVTNNGATFTATAEANNNPDPRIDTVYVQPSWGSPLIVCKIVVKQLGTNPQITPALSTVAMPKLGKAVTIPVTAGADPIVAGTPSDSWLTASITGNQLTLTSLDNTTTSERTATVVLTSGKALPVTIKVIQSNNLITNGGFESWYRADSVANWSLYNKLPNTLSQVTSDVSEGLSAIKFDVPSTGGTTGVAINIPVSANKTYTLTYYYNNNSKTASSSGIRHWCYLADANITYKAVTDPIFTNNPTLLPKLQPASTLDPVTVWTKHTETITIPNDPTIVYFVLQLRCSKTNKGSYDNVSFVENP